jgi:hypothetical protein
LAKPKRPMNTSPRSITMGMAGAITDPVIKI